MKMSQCEPGDFKKFAREELEELLEQINGSESPDLINLKMKGYGQRVTAYIVRDFLSKSRNNG